MNERTAEGARQWGFRDEAGSKGWRFRQARHAARAAPVPAWWVKRRAYRESEAWCRSRCRWCATGDNNLSSARAVTLPVGSRVMAFLWPLSADSLAALAARRVGLSSRPRDHQSKRVWWMSRVEAGKQGLRRAILCRRTLFCSSEGGRAGKASTGKGSCRDRRQGSRFRGRMTWMRRELFGAAQRRAGVWMRGRRCGRRRIVNNVADGGGGTKTTRLGKGAEVEGGHACIQVSYARGSRNDGGARR